MELPLEKDAHVVSQEEELKDLYLYSLKAGSHRIQYLPLTPIAFLSYTGTHRLKSRWLPKRTMGNSSKLSPTAH